MSLAWLLTVTFVISLIGTDLLRRYALARRVLDIPNNRSSHRVPTPRGGGLAIVIAFLAGTLMLWASGGVDASTTVALLGAGALVALVGFLDDHRPVAARRRLVAHFAAAAWALFWLGGLPPVQFFGRELDLGLGGNVIATIALVWLLNLYNFMDGIDGIAGTEGVTVCLGAVLLSAVQPAGNAEWVLPSLLAVASLGFLALNFPPAKIFMGDAGSGFLGLMLGVLAVHAAGISSTWLWSWVILLGVFVVDSTVTLLHRLWRRERVYEAHRNHAYQRAARRIGRHRTVTLSVAAINVFWLLPFALMVGTGHLNGFLGTVIGYVPLIWLAHWFGAGASAVD
jgi:Fuc2NAc and GlcNAc transferase